MLDYAHNPLHTFPRNVPVDGVVDKLLRTCYGETGVMDVDIYRAAREQLLSPSPTSSLVFVPIPPISISAVYDPKAVNTQCYRYSLQLLRRSVVVTSLQLIAATIAASNGSTVYSPP